MASNVQACVRMTMSVCDEMIYSSQFRGENFSTTCSRVDLSDDIVLGTITSMYACIITSGLLVLHVKFNS